MTDSAPTGDAAGTSATDAPTGRRRLSRTLKLLAVVVTLMLVAGAATGFYLYQRLEGNIGVFDAFDPDVVGTDRPTKAPPEEGQEREPLNILVMGSDTREGQGTGYGSGAAITGARSDTTLIVHLPANRESAMVVSIPRDTIIDIPSCKTDTGLSTPYTDRFNAAFSIGGPGCTIKTVEQNTGVFIDHFVIVDFSGFNDIVDALGGVDVCLPYDVVEPKSGLNLPAGVSTVTGDQALAFVRVRAIGTGSDIDRIDRQQAFLSSLIDKARSSGTLLNPIKLVRFLEAATKSLTTDPELANLNRMRQLAQEVRGIPPKNITFITTPWVVNPDDPNTVVWNTEKTDALWTAITTDETYPPPPPEPTVIDGKPLTVAPETISVRVLNGTGEDGIATTAAAKLTKQGYTIVGIGDAVSTDYLSTIVRYDVGGEEAARTVAASLPGAHRVKAPGLGTTIEVVVGQDWPGVTPVVVKEAQEDDGVRQATDNICNIPG
ncbi:MAG: LCP family protein [Actinomycetia bacterium]|nr:LCP family protein [Actinomycetes bacterium]